MESQFQINTTENIIKIVKKLGKESTSEYNLFPLIIIISSIAIIIMYLIKIELNINGTNWEKNKCSSKYIFFSGLMKNSGDGMEQSLVNFNECITRFL
jgi:hypothetical protein